MGISVLYVRISSLDGKTDRQRVNEEEFDRVIEDKCSGSIPIFEREGGRQLKKWIDEGVISSISIWQIDRSGRDLRDILNFIHYTTQRKIPIHFISQGLRTIDENGEENPISKMVISILGVVAFLVLFSSSFVMFSNYQINVNFLLLFLVSVALALFYFVAIPTVIRSRLTTDTSGGTSLVDKECELIEILESDTGLVLYKDTKLRVNLELDKSYKEKQNYIFLEKDGNLYI